jgi:hypothetical protein
MCNKCSSTDGKNLAHVYDLDYPMYFVRFLDRHAPDIAKYREKIATGQVDNNNDIAFQSTYQSLMQSIGQKPFISLMLHLDGISLGESNKLSLWLFSCSIIELPPHLRNKRSNMPLLSAWAGYREPVVELWLRACIPSLLGLKSLGVLLHLF